MFDKSGSQFARVLPYNRASPEAPLDPQVRIAQLERELQWAQLKIQVLEERLRQQRIQLLGPQQRDAERSATGVAGGRRAGRDGGRSRGGERARARCTRVRRGSASRIQAGSLAGESAARRTSDRACAEQNCRSCGERDGRDRLRRKRATGCRAGAVFRARDQARKAGLPELPREGTVQMAPLEPRIVEKGLASDRVVIDTVVAKYCDHLPLYRQAAMLEREAGVEIGRATLDGWVMRVGELLEPVVGAMRASLLKSSYLQADETTVPVQMHDRRGADHQAYLWQYGKPGGETVFDFSWGVGARVRRNFLGHGKASCKPMGTQAYDGVGGPKLVHVGCWAHARRKFVDAVKVHPDDGEADADGDADGRVVCGRSRGAAAGDERGRSGWRRGASMPWSGSKKFIGSVSKLRRTELPKSALGQAVNYMSEHVGEASAVLRAMRKWSCPTIWRRTRCGRWRWGARTGCTWAARRRGRR